VPVHPAAAEIDGVPAYRRVQDVPGGIDAAFLMTPPAATDQVVQDCAAAGVHTVWMHRGAGQGSVSQSAVDLCRQHGIAVVPGACPYMFLPDANLFHRLHRLILTMFGRKAA
jgi:acyl-CoA synthetase (NDP forming)